MSDSEYIPDPEFLKWKDKTFELLEKMAVDNNWEICEQSNSQSTSSCYCYCLPQKGGLYFNIRLSDHPPGPKFNKNGDLYSIIQDCEFEILTKIDKHLKSDPRAYVDFEKRIYHYSICPLIKEIKKEYLIILDDYMEACDQGYDYCNKCRPPIYE